MSIITTRITIGIATFRETRIADTLMSLSRLVLPLDTTLTILVADTDDEPSAQTTVASIAAQTGLPITYLHMPGAGAHAAIRAAATGDYLALLDDTTIADPAWLSELLSKQRSSAAATVLGPVRAIYLPGTPRWLTIGNFHSLYPSENSIDYTHNMLTKLPATNTTVTTAPGAVLYAIIPPRYATLGWLLARFTRDGRTYAAALIAARHSRPWQMLLAAIRMLKAYGMMLLCIVSPLGRRRFLLRGTLQLAVLTTLWHNSPTP